MALTLQKLVRERNELSRKWNKQLQLLPLEKRKVWRKRFTFPEGKEEKELPSLSEFTCDLCKETKNTKTDTESLHTEGPLVHRWIFYTEGYFSICGACSRTHEGREAEKELREAGKHMDPAYHEDHVREGNRKLLMNQLGHLGLTFLGYVGVFAVGVLVGVFGDLKSCKVSEANSRFGVESSLLSGS